MKPSRSRPSSPEWPAPRGVKGFVADAVEHEFLAVAKRRHLAQFAFNDGFAGLDIFIDQAVGVPGQIVLERIGWILRQRPDPEAHVVQLVEALAQMVGRDRNESRSQSTLGNECCF